MRTIKQMLGVLLFAIALTMVAAGFAASDPNSGLAFITGLEECGRIIGVFYIIIILVWLGINLLDN